MSPCLLPLPVFGVSSSPGCSKFWPLSSQFSVLCSEFWTLDFASGSAQSQVECTFCVKVCEFHVCVCVCWFCALLSLFVALWPTVRQSVGQIGRQKRSYWRYLIHDMLTILIYLLCAKFRAWFGHYQRQRQTWSLSVSHCDQLAICLARLWVYSCVSMSMCVQLNEPVEWMREMFKLLLTRSLTL